MSSEDSLEEAVDVLQQLGLKEYEARCFVGLCRLATATAKELGEITDVPRTRVYDAVRVLEAQGLVEVQHSSPQRFRAVTIAEATRTLRDGYEARIERLRDALADVERTEAGDTTVQEVWSMAGRRAIENRVVSLVDDATREVMLVLGHESVVTEDLIVALNGLDDGADLLVGALSDDVRNHVDDAVPAATAFLSGLEWLQSPDGERDELVIGRLLLVDRSTLLVSTVGPDTGEERAVFGSGVGNGLVVVARRLMTQRMVAGRDPL